MKRKKIGDRAMKTEKRKKKIRWEILILTVCCTALVIGGLSLGGFLDFVIDNGDKVTVTIDEIEEEKSPSEIQEGEKVIDVYVSYEYQGQQYTHVGATSGKYHKTLKEGAPLRMYVNPENPMELKTREQMISASQTIFIFAAVIGIITVLRGTRIM